MTVPPVAVDTLDDQLLRISQLVPLFQTVSNGQVKTVSNLSNSFEQSQADATGPHLERERALLRGELPPALLDGPLADLALVVGRAAPRRPAKSRQGESNI
jgi:hypothetical protein